MNSRGFPMEAEPVGFLGVVGFVGFIESVGSIRADGGAYTEVHSERNPINRFML